jgi:hypothetical protein
LGSKGCCFCTEGCSHRDRQAGEPAPPREIHDIDDEFDASTVLLKVIGPPPPHVVIRRFRYDPEIGEDVIDVYPAPTTEIPGPASVDRPNCSLRTVVQGDK